MAAIRGEKKPLKIWKIFLVHFFDMTNPHKNCQHSKIRNGEKKVSDLCVPLMASKKTLIEISERTASDRRNTFKLHRLAEHDVVITCSRSSGKY